MGSCFCRPINNQVVDLDTTSYPDVVVERITHISADIHEKIRKKMPKKDAGESLSKNVGKVIKSLKYFHIQSFKGKTGCQSHT